MSHVATQNPSVKGGESKSAMKKKAKQQLQQEETAPAAATPALSAEKEESSNGDGSYESPYIKELYKSIRNVKKKITNASKADSIVTDNPNLTLDQLVAARKLNNDQKAQLEKKPALQASLTQLEDQIAQYQKFDQEYKVRLATEKAELEESYKKRAAEDLKNAVEEAKKQGSAEATQNTLKEQRGALLLISKFLNLAAVRRMDGDETLAENKALEGILSKVYVGDESAVEVMTKIIEGSAEQVVAVDDEALPTTFADIKKIISENFDSSEDNSNTNGPSTNLESDPTIANAGLTEIDEPTVVALANGHAESFAPDDHVTAVGSGNIGEGGNEAAEVNTESAKDLSTSQEWVKVPHEVENDATAATANQSWADDQPDTPTTDIKTSLPNEATPRVQGQGQQPHRNRNREGANARQAREKGDREGSQGPAAHHDRGGHRGGHRGRGWHHGDNRGRGRGDRGGARGARGGQES